MSRRKILNPLTGRMVYVNGKVGRRVRKECKGSRVRNGKLYVSVSRKTGGCMWKRVKGTRP